MKMPRALILCSLSALLALTRAAPAQQTSTIQVVAESGLTRVALRAQWEPIANDADKSGSAPKTGHLRIFRNADGSLIQTVGLELKAGDARQARLEFKDLDADGYEDLLLEDASGPAGGEIKWTEVFMWDPTRARFQHDTALSREGEVTLGLHPGCVDLTSRCSATAFHRRIYCHEKSEGLWELVKDADCEGDGVD